MPITTSAAPRCTTNDSTPPVLPRRLRAMRQPVPGGAGFDDLPSRRSAMAAQRRGSVNVLVQPLRISRRVIATAERPPAR
jgi:hypothetical protein